MIIIGGSLHSRGDLNVLMRLAASNIFLSGLAASGGDNSGNFFMGTDLTPSTVHHQVYTSGGSI